MRGDVAARHVKFPCGFHEAGVRKVAAELAARPLDADPTSSAHMRAWTGHASALPAGSRTGTALARRRLFLPYVAALAMVAISTIAGTLLAPRWGNSAVDLLYLPTILASAILFGLWPALVAGLASALAYNFFFTPPFHTFRMDRPADIVTVVILFLGRNGHQQARVERPRAGGARDCPRQPQCHSRRVCRPAAELLRQAGDRIRRLHARLARIFALQRGDGRRASDAARSSPASPVACR